MSTNLARQLAGGGSGQSLVDRLTSAKHSLAGSLVAKTICKATTEEMISPKKKHLSNLANLTFDGRLSIPDFSKFLLDRLQSHNWVVVFKGLITTHHLMQYGSDRFSEFLASNSSQLAANKISERNPHYSMIRYVRLYANYLKVKCECYAQVGFDFCKIKRGKEEGNLRKMNQEKLFNTLPVLERLLDALTDFSPSVNELTSNSLLRAAHLLLYKDLIRLYAVYNEGMINLIERYFDMPKKQCQEALVLYKSYVTRMEALSVFGRIAEEVSSSTYGDSLGDGQLFKPDIHAKFTAFDNQNSVGEGSVPQDVLATLESHLASLETRKPGADRLKALPSPSVARQIAETPPQWTGSASVPAQRSGSASVPPTGQNGVSQREMHLILEEEQNRLDSFLKNVNSSKASSMNADSDDGWAKSFAKRDSNPWQIDLAAKSDQPAQPATSSTASTAQQDLLLLDFDNFEQKPSGPGAPDLLTANVAPPSVQSNPFALVQAAASPDPFQLNQQRNLAPNPFGQFNPFGVPAGPSFPPSFDQFAATSSTTTTTTAGAESAWQTSPFMPASSNGTSTATTVSSSGGPMSADLTLEERMEQLAGNLISPTNGASGQPNQPVNWRFGAKGFGPTAAQKPSNPWANATQLRQPSTNPFL